MTPRGKASVGLVLGMQLLLAPAGQACGELARMSGSCPMIEPAAPLENQNPKMRDADPASASRTGHGHHAAGRTRPAADPETQMRCHGSGPPEADCCPAATGAGEVAAVVTANVKQTSIGAAVMPPGASAGSTRGVGRVHPAWRLEPPPLDELPRYARFSSYLL